MNKKIILFGDTFGINQLLKYTPTKQICMIVCASIRPQYIDELRVISQNSNIPLLVQPKIDSDEYKDFVLELSRYQPDLLICNSYSMIIRQDIRNIFHNNCINIHWSLLPKNRGPNPIQWAIIKDEKKTGITIHYMDDGIDTGDILVQQETPIEEKDTWVTLRNKLLFMSDKLLEKELPNIIAGNMKSTKQDEKNSSVNFRLDENYPKIDFTKMNDYEIYNLIRAQINPLKGAYIELEDTREYIDQFISYDAIQKLRQKYEK